ncbi:MAG: hypothetical protein HYY17_10685 [Planctomycetes bacterium]|nr:hypothetical protein [Planctomycetota bacterium]
MSCARIVTGRLIVLAAKLSLLAAALGIVAALIPAIPHGRCAGRQGGTQHLIDNLSQATEMYQIDFGAYPPSGASFAATMGSASLGTALRSVGPGKQQYFDFRPGDIDASGNIVSPIRPDREFLSYRNNRQSFPGNAGDPNAHNKKKFDLWCADCEGKPDGVDNW